MQHSGETRLRGRKVTTAVVTTGMVAAAWCSIAAAAFAHTNDNRDAGPTFSKISLALDGRIAPRCELGAGAAIDFGELTGGEVATAVMAFECNVPFDISFQSARGGLAHAMMPNGQGPFTGTLGYSLDVTVPTRSPGPRTLRASYESRNLIGRQTLSSDEAIAAGGARLQFRTEAPRGAGLLAGDYSETLSVTVAPRF